MWLVRTDENGIVLWDRTYGGTENERARALIQTTDGGFALAGRTWTSSSGFGPGFRDMWMVKTDEDGSKQWDQTYSGTERGGAVAIIQTIDSGFALAGYTASLDTVSYVDMWLVITDANGGVQWNQTYGGNYHDVAFDLIQTVDGSFVLAGITEARWYLPYYGGGDVWLFRTGVDGRMLSSNTDWIPRLVIFPLLATVIVLVARYKREKRTEVGGVIEYD